MSDHDQQRREWRFYLQDMIKFALKVQSYSADMDQAGFIAKDLT